MVRHWRKTGKVEPNKPKAKERTKINIDWLRNQFANKEDKLLKDIVLKYKEEMNITVAISSIRYALQSIDLSHKKTVFARERESARVKDLRAEFLAEQVELKDKRLFFLDESGFRLGSCSRYGWSQKGEKAYGSETCGSWKTITMLGAINADNICSFMTIDSGTTLDVFNVFIDTQINKTFKKR